MKEEANYPFQYKEGNLGEHRAKSERIQLNLGRMSLTRKQAKVLEFLAEHSHQLGFPPSVREIGDYFGISVKAASDHLRAIAKKDYINLFPHRARGIEIKKNSLGVSHTKNQSSHHTQEFQKDLVSVPLIGRIAAGVPILAEENIEENLLLPQALLPQTGVFFALQISGDSMKNMGILNGDIAIIQKVEDFRNEIKNGDIVAALINSEATLKTYTIHNKMIELHPENDAYTKITLDPKDESQILGKLKGIYRKY